MLIVIFNVIWISIITLLTANITIKQEVKLNIFQIKNIQTHQCTKCINILKTTLNFANNKNNLNKVDKTQSKYNHIILILNNKSKQTKNNQYQYFLIKNKQPINKLNKYILQNNPRSYTIPKTIYNQIKPINIISTIQLIQKQKIILKTLYNKLKITFPSSLKNIETKLKYNVLKIKKINKKLKLIIQYTKLNNNKNELPYLNIKIIKEHNHIFDQNTTTIYHQTTNLNKQKQTENNKKIEKNSNPSNIINDIILINNKLSNDLRQQQNHIELIISQQKIIAKQIAQTQQTLINLTEQSKWLGKSYILGETLRCQISKLPKVPKYQQLDQEIAHLYNIKLQFKDQINQLDIKLQNKLKYHKKLTYEQNKILDLQINIQYNLLNSLLNICDTQIIEITKLKIAHEQLKKIIKEIKIAAHKYLFWTADANPISLSYPSIIYKDLKKIFNRNNIHQFQHLLKTIFIKKTILIPLISLLLLIGLQTNLKKYYFSFIQKTNNKIHKKNNTIKFQYLILIIIISTINPIIWTIIGYYLIHNCSYNITISIGDGIINTIPVLWLVILIRHLINNQQILIKHLEWTKIKMFHILNCYSKIIWIIIPLITIITILENYNDREFFNSIGRLLFIILCLYIYYITNNFKKYQIYIYIDKQKSENNIINKILWHILQYTPIITAISAYLGYMTTSKTLLTRVETSVFIWIISSIIYHIIKNWILIQNKLIPIKYITKNNIQTNVSNFNKNKTQKKNNNQINTHNINNTNIQSLQLIRSTIIIVASLLIILLWSELHPAFEFLNKITLWNIHSYINGSEIIQSITIYSILISIITFIITTKIVKYLPSLLEIVLLHHLNLTQGSKYAIITITKYILMLLGSIIGFTLIGIEWSKLQWLIAAIGVGLGFGLQEIFANFISGLIILFEKPIRIGDTITISKLTGNVTHINTRATTIIDWDHKEIIIPNKEFITSQFVNWSLSDTITKVTLKILSPEENNIEKITQLLIDSAKCCPLVLHAPPPEVYIIDLQHGIPLFEIRLYAAKITHRMPLRHQVNILILNNFKKNGLKLPYPKFHIYTNKIYKKNKNKSQPKPINTIKN